MGIYRSMSGYCPRNKLYLSRAVNCNWFKILLCKLTTCRSKFFLWNGSNSGKWRNISFNFWALNSITVESVMLSTVREAGSWLYIAIKSLIHQSLIANCSVCSLPSLSIQNERRLPWETKKVLFTVWPSRIKIYPFDTDFSFAIE